jgi:hypothetical protein
MQVLLLFRRHGLSGSPDSLEQFKAYSMSPYRILCNVPFRVGAPGRRAK